MNETTVRSDSSERLNESRRRGVNTTMEPAATLPAANANMEVHRSPLRVSWGAIIAGSVIGLAILFMLSLLGIGIGSAVIDPAQGGSSLSGVGVGSGVFVIAAQLVALAAGGYIAARLAGIPLGMSSALHGAAVWAVATFAMVFLATTTIGGVMGGAASLIGSAGSGVASAAEALVPDDIKLSQIDQSSLPPAVQQAMEEQGITPAELQRDAEAVFSSTISEGERQEIMAQMKDAAAAIATSPGSAGEEIDSLIDQLIGGNGGVLSQEDRDQAINSLSERLGISPREAEQTIDQWQKQFSETVESVKAGAVTAQEELVQAAQASSEALSKAALAAFVASLAGLAIAMGAGYLGRPARVGSRI